MRMKKMFAFLVSLVMLLTMFSANITPVNAAEEVTGIAFTDASPVVYGVSAIGSDQTLALKVSGNGLGSATIVNLTSANPSVISVNPQATWTGGSGKTADFVAHVQLNKAGTASITATSGGVSTSITLTLKQGVESITVEPAEHTMTVGEYKQFVAKVLPTSANNKEVVWSSSKVDVAFVNVETGRIRADKPGTTIIRATAKDGTKVYGEATVVVRPKVEGITVEGPSRHPIEQPFELKALVTPEAAEQGVKWTVDPTRATLVDNGDGTAIVTLHKTGETWIDATSIENPDKNFVGHKVIGYIPVTSISFDEDAMTIRHRSSPNNMHKIPINISPNNTTSQTFKWTSSDPTVATFRAPVDSAPKKLDDGRFYGVLHTLKGGTVTLTVETTDGSNLKATMELTVEVGVNTITLTPNEYLILNVRDTQQVKAEISPSTATNKKVIWSIADEKIATVDENGVVTGVAEGRTTLTATAADGYGAKASIAINVRSVKASSVTLDPALSYVVLGEPSAPLKVTLTPENTTMQQVKWISLDPTVALVDQNGMITGLKENAYARIRVETMDGSNQSAVARVFVSPKGTTLPPAAPGMPKHSMETLGRVNLSWNRVEGAVGYNIYTSSTRTGPYTLLASTTETSHSYTEAKRGVVVFYTITAYTVDRSGVRIEGQRSPYGGLFMGAMPQVRVVKSAYGQPLVRWDSHPDADGYIVVRGRTADGGFLRIAATKSLHYHDITATTGTYFYKVVPYKLVPGGGRTFLGVWSEPVRFDGLVGK